MFRRRKSADFSAEIQAHIRLEADRLRETGMSESDAQAAARRGFGNLTATEERFYESRRPAWWDHIGCDLRLAFRSLNRERVFAAFAILLIGLGAGLATTMFALFDAVALRKLAVPAPDSLFHIVAWKDGAEASVRYAIFERLRANLDVVDSIFAETGTILPVTYNRETRMSSIQYSAGDYYRTMGVRPLLGRWLTPADDGPVAVISDSYWRRLGADPAIIGKTVRAGPALLTIVGVVPDAAHAIIRFGKTDLAVPLGIGMLLEGVSPQRVYRYNLEVTARLKAGVTPAQLQQRLDAMWPRLLAETVPPGQSLEEWTRTSGARARLLPGNRGRLWTMADLPRVTLTLLILAGLVSLTMCSNLAGVLLSRGLGRQKEYAVRIALGAGRWRLVRLALCEVLVLSFLGCGAALLLTQWLTGLCALLLRSGNPWLDYGVRVDRTVAVFALLLSVATAVAAQLLPALRLSCLDLRGAMNHGSRTFSARLGSRRVMLAVQLAASMVLVSGALLFVRTVQSMMRVDLGFDARNVLAVRLTGRAPWSEAGPEFFQDLLQRVRAIPAVTTAGLADRVPMELTYEDAAPIAAAAGGAAGEVRGEAGCVWPGFLNAMRVPILSGRDFRDSETGVILLTRELAQSLFPQGDALGSFVRTGKSPKQETYQVTGVIGDIRFRTPRQPHARMFLVPCRQLWTAPQTKYAMSLAIRVAGSPADVEAAVRREIESMGRQAIVEAIPLEGLISKSMRSESMLTAAAAGFSVCTLILSCAGIYALIDLSARARRREFGIRMALGADRRWILQLLLTEAVQVIAFGACGGVAASLVMGRVYRAYLYGVANSEPLLVAIAVTVVSFFAIGAALAPAWKAASRPPAEVMHTDV